MQCVQRKYPDEIESYNLSWKRAEQHELTTMQRSKSHKTAPHQVNGSQNSFCDIHARQKKDRTIKKWFLTSFVNEMRKNEKQFENITYGPHVYCFVQNALQNVQTL